MNSNSVCHGMFSWKAQMTELSRSVLTNADSYLFKYWLLRFMDEREVEVTS